MEGAPVPRISDEYLDCTIYLYPSASHACSGQRSGGSGFLVSVQMSRLPNAYIIYAVTNAHVIEKGNTTIRLNMQDGTFDVRELDDRHWLLHPSRDDLAIYQLSNLDQAVYKYKCVADHDLISKAMVDEFNVGPGDDVFVAGRFINVEGKQRNTPSMRFGNIAQMPWEPIKQQRAFGEHYQESFLVEARTISGYSGSPVFLFMLRTIIRPGRPELIKDQICLLGITWGYIKNWERVCNEFDIPLDLKYKVPINTGMMGVVPAWKLAELLHSPELRQKRERIEDEFIRVHGPSTTELT
jgi:hypothetical protein